MQTYESQLNGDLNWALLEGSMHCDGTNAVHRTMRRLVEQLIQEINLRQDFASEIISEVRDSYLTLWKDSQQILKDDI